MERMKQSEIKNLVRIGAAVDITAADAPIIPDAYHEVVAVSRGINGLNGALIKGDGGTLYAICSRCANLFIMV